MAEQLKYRAFLSYSHEDTATAKRVHGALEGFRIDKDLFKVSRVSTRLKTVGQPGKAVERGFCPTSDGHAAYNGTSLGECEHTPRV